MDDAGEQKIQRTEAKNREDVRAIDDEWVLRDREDGRYGIHRKDQIGRLNEGQHDEEWGRGEPQRSATFFTHEEALSVVGGSHWQQPTYDPDRHVRFQIDIVLDLGCHANPSKDQERSKQVHHPVKLLYQV